MIYLLLFVGFVSGAAHVFTCLSLISLQKLVIRTEEQSYEYMRHVSEEFEFVYSKFAKENTK